MTLKDSEYRIRHHDSNIYIIMKQNANYFYILMLSKYGTQLFTLFFLHLKLKYEKNLFKIDVLSSIDNVNYQKHIHYDTLKTDYLYSIPTGNRSS